MDPTAFDAMVIMVLWGLGGGMVICLAGLQGIPSELREAAAVDGANPVQAFRAITLPLLTPVLFFQLVTGIIFSLQTLVQPLLLAESIGTISSANVPRSNYLYMVNVYQQVFGNQRLGYGAALLWVLFAVILAITLVVFATGRLWVYYEVDPGRGT
jgi:multiple sugar transport system permease protein